MSCPSVCSMRGHHQQVNALPSCTCVLPTPLSSHNGGIRTPPVLSLFPLPPILAPQRSISVIYWSSVESGGSNCWRPQMITKASKSDCVFWDAPFLLVSASAHLHSQVFPGFLSCFKCLHKCLTQASVCHCLSFDQHVSQREQAWGVFLGTTTRPIYLFLKAASSFPINANPRFSETKRMDSPKFGVLVFQKGFHSFPGQSAQCLMTKMVSIKLLLFTCLGYLLTSASVCLLQGMERDFWWPDRANSPSGDKHPNNHTISETASFSTTVKRCCGDWRLSSV